ncbi:MAG: SMI1/KNR4 family protein [Gracilibacteraceae bacterium]|jgi:tetratricopeptide (TPR) repeat protein|nr:SMI1/KNR4 family protein [Gracilibacteraceae bacterium]
MSKKTLLAKIAAWHTSREHDKIYKAITALPENERDAEFLCLLARALSNEDDYSGALKTLESIRAGYSGDPYFCLRYALALYQLHREPEAVDWFKKARDLGLEEIDESPGTYLPKSVAKWLERAERRTPPRIEKNAFAARRRAQRKERGLKAVDFDAAAFDGLWDDCRYSLEKYVGSIPSDADISATEFALGYRLPASYKQLIRRHNGGLLARDCFENPLQRDWTPRTFGVNGIFGIDRGKPYSLCGTSGSRFWIDEWGYPDIGVAICDCPSGGHDMIFLDYSDCGPAGEPCVVHVDQEGEYEISYLADSFYDFVCGLAPEGD